jgi:CRP/FNR family transcriptional regulator, cyclic AMP receptor protein
LSKAEQAALRELGRPGEFRAGGVLCTEGQQSADLFVLITGWVKILSAAGNGRELLLALRGQGDVVGEIAGERDGFRTATVKAAGLVSSLIVPYDTFTQFLSAHPGADRAYRHAITQRWSEAAGMLYSRSVHSAPQRLAALLVDLAERHGTPGKGGTLITIPLSQEEIASLIGASRATVTRALSDWRHRGLISTNRRHLTITNTTPLNRIARRHPHSEVPAP